MKWDKASIKDICLGIYDGPHATPPLSDTGGIFLGIPNFVNGRLDLNNVRYISEKDLPKWTKRVTPKENDIVFSYEATLNLYAIIPEGFHGCLGRRMGLLRVDKSKVFYKFLYYYFFSERWQRVIKENTVLGSTVDRLPLIKFPDFPVFLPSLQTQYKIASILSAYDDLIENNQKQIKLLEEAAQRLYKEWFVDLHFPGHEDVKIVDGVPEGWSRKQIFELGKIITGKTPNTSKQEYYGGSIPFVKIPDMHNCIYTISTESTLTKFGADKQKNNYIPENSIMVSCIGTVGLVNISSELCQTNQQINSIVLKNREDVYYLFFSMKMLKTLLDGVGSNGATMINVNKSKFSSIEILYPNAILRNKYFSIAKPYFRKIYYLSKQISSLREARDRLLPKLMSGEIEV
ncbi:restriction endonuclease subunit S [Phascolarctobacterium succinatutens]